MRISRFQILVNNTLEDALVFIYCSWLLIWKFFFWIFPWWVLMMFRVNYVFFSPTFIIMLDVWFWWCLSTVGGNKETNAPVYLCRGEKAFFLTKESWYQKNTDVRYMLNKLLFSIQLNNLSIFLLMVRNL